MTKCMTKRDQMSECVEEYFYNVAVSQAETIDMKVLTQKFLASDQGQETLGLAIEEAISRRSFGPEFAQAAEESLKNGVLTDLKKSVSLFVENRFIDKLRQAQQDVIASEQWKLQLEQAVRRVMTEKSVWGWFKRLVGVTA